MWITICGMIISSIVSVMLSDKIIFDIDRLFVKLGVSKYSYVAGLWKATFAMGYGKNKIEYTEIILLKKRFGTIYGYIVDDDRNYEQLQLVMKKIHCD